MELNKIYNEDCLVGMKKIPDASVHCIVTDIPYNECNRTDNGLRNLDKGKADIGIFDVAVLTENLCDKTKGSIYMFCGFNQVSTIRQTMSQKGLSTRIVVWEKTNPSPMNGSVIWLNGVELCVYGKKQGATFNFHCKNTVFRYPCGGGQNSSNTEASGIDVTTDSCKYKRRRYRLGSFYGQRHYCHRLYQRKEELHRL